MQGEGGGTPPEKGTRLARAECNDSLEEKRKTGRTRRKIGGTVEKQGERERVHRIERKDASSAALVAVFYSFSPASTMRTFVCGLWSRGDKWYRQTAALRCRKCKQSAFSQPGDHRLQGSNLPPCTLPIVRPEWPDTRCEVQRRCYANGKSADPRVQVEKHAVRVHFVLWDIHLTPERGSLSSGMYFVRPIVDPDVRSLLFIRLVNKYRLSLRAY